MTDEKPVDHSKRLEALDPSRSFIVQAPAGSGKTGLLTQRLLGLLARVRRPEEILAITFTRKAAAQMRQRVLEALIHADSKPRPDSCYHALTWDLAGKALDNDRSLGWNLLDNPSRLNIRTIDSFCLQLAERMPLLSGLGSRPAICQEPESLYQEAARNTLLEINRRSKWHAPLKTLLVLMDNDWNKAGNLIQDMLKLRDHWLRLIGGSHAHIDLKKILENHLEVEVRKILNQVRSALNQFLDQKQANTFLKCAAYAGNNVRRENTDSSIKHLQGITSLPGTAAEDITPWLAVKELLMTKDSKWRKTVNIKQGFPSPSKSKKDQSKAHEDHKNSFLSLLKNLQAADSQELLTSLSLLDNIPETRYDQTTWQNLDALIQVLKMAVAQLHLVMARRNEMDYPELVRGALEAMGPPDRPSRLLLGLDCRIQHILFDEFQDTSISQQEILERLISGWTEGDGRTLFLVGDPMQSIYGFRDADVGVFLSTRQNPPAGIRLQPLELKCNFRSSPEVVEWINTVFPDVFQDKEEPVSGSVRYSPMTACVPESGQVLVHPLVDPGPQEEALKVLDIIRHTLQHHPRESIAVLVRQRPHLKEIMDLLRPSGLSFQAVEIQSLAQSQIVMDLLSLTKVLIRPHDRLSWLAVFRAPWAGLDLKDLTMLASAEHQLLIPKILLSSKNTVQALSAHGKERLAALAEIFSHAWVNRRRRPLADQVRALWMSLGGPACTLNQEELKDAQTFLEHLEKLAGPGWDLTIPELELSLEKLYSGPAPADDNPVNIMTIHKAKGLEFDTVIIPGLEKIPRSQGKLLLQFMEVPGDQGSSGISRLLLAPISSTGSDSHPTYKYIQQLKNLRENNEIGRLLYVAATRAGRRLHLIASAKTRDTGEESLDLAVPPRKSFLYPMWDRLSHEFKARLRPDIQKSPHGGQNPSQKHNILYRLNPAWQMPDLKCYNFKGMPAGPLPLEQDREVIYDWAGEVIRRVGTVVHAFLKTIAQDGPEKWSTDAVQASAGLLEHMLVREGVLRADLDFARNKALLALTRTLACPTGRWILSGHDRAENEYQLSTLSRGQLTRVVIDRTFVDSEKTRWIIDYKISSHEGGGLDEFLDREADRYRPQLLKYRQIMKSRESAPVRMGLYFPLLQAWREIQT
ncbi:MAG: UvrD-helicase domain-containing protein [Desulfonatronovibrionaceae bacterium]